MIWIDPYSYLICFNKRISLNWVQLPVSKTCSHHTCISNIFSIFNSFRTPVPILFRVRSCCQAKIIMIEEYSPGLPYFLLAERYIVHQFQLTRYLFRSDSTASTGCSYTECGVGVSRLCDSITLTRSNTVQIFALWIVSCDSYILWSYWNSSSFQIDTALLQSSRESGSC